MREKIIENKALDRRISVAPMMDWTDDLNSAFYIKSLGLLEMA
jgi:tRNA-dihydrouridine synthase